METMRLEVPCGFRSFKMLGHPPLGSDEILGFQSLSLGHWVTGSLGGG